jgi:hypothetical protein
MLAECKANREGIKIDFINKSVLFSTKISFGRSFKLVRRLL